jgi:hypothetical protein
MNWIVCYYQTSASRSHEPSSVTVDEPDPRLQHHAPTWILKCPNKRGQKPNMDFCRKSEVSKNAKLSSSKTFHSPRFCPVIPHGCPRPLLSYIHILCQGSNIRWTTKIQQLNLVNSLRRPILSGIKRGRKPTKKQDKNSEVRKAEILWKDASTKSGS